MSVNVVRSRLYLISLQKHRYGASIQGLLKLGFFPESDAFFSFTETDDEISVILDENSLKHFQDSLTTSSFVISPGNWRAIEVSFKDTNLISQVGVISKISNSIIEHDKNVHMLYVSQYKSDFILVKEEFLDKGCRRLNTAFPRIRELELVKKSTTKTASKIVVTPHPEVLHLMSAKDPKELPKFAHALLELMFFPKSEKRFFSYTRSSSELSIIVSTENVNLLPLELFDVDPGKWRALQIVGDETGISGTNVNILSEALASANVSILYLSTFYTDFILVPNELVSEAIASLKKSLGVIVEDE